MVILKTTLEIPDLLYRRLKSSAATQGKTVKALVNEAIVEKLRQPVGPASPAWRKGFGQLRHLRNETRKVERIIDAEFSRVDPEEWK